MSAEPEPNARRNSRRERGVFITCNVISLLLGVGVTAACAPPQVAEMYARWLKTEADRSKAETEEEVAKKSSAYVIGQRAADYERTREELRQERVRSNLLLKEMQALGARAASEEKRLQVQQELAEIARDKAKEELEHTKRINEFLIKTAGERLKQEEQRTLRSIIERHQAESRQQEAQFNARQKAAKDEQQREAERALALRREAEERRKEGLAALRTYRVKAPIGEGILANDNGSPSACHFDRGDRVKITARGPTALRIEKQSGGRSGWLSNEKEFYYLERTDEP